MLSGLSSVLRGLDVFISRRGIILLTGCVFTLCMALLFIFQPFFLRLVEFKIYDVQLRSLPQKSASPQLVIVDLDEESLEEFGQWPWPRYRVALLLEKIRRAGAVSIGLDIVFAEKDRTSPVVIQKYLQSELGVKIDFEGLPPGLEDNDAILANLLGQGPYVLGYYLDMRQGEKNREHLLHPVQAAVVGPPDAPALDDSLFLALGATSNIEILAKAAPGSGFMNVAPDADGIIRKVPLLMAYEGKVYPNLAMATLMNVIGSRQVLVRSTDSGPESIRLGDVSIPVDSRGQLLLNYRGPGGSFEYISAGRVLNDGLAPAELAGKIVLVGTSAAGLKDIRATPLDPVYPGVEAQATVVDNIMKSDFLYRPDWALGLELVLVVGLGLLSTVALVWLSGWWLIVPLGLCAAGLWWGSIHLLGFYGLHVSPFMPLLALSGNFSILSFQKFWIEEKEKRRIKNTFEHYLSPEVIRWVMNKPDRLKLGGENRDLSVMFMDIRNFTSISEVLKPEELVEFMNDFLTKMTEVIMNNGGTLDKYMGDAIMAFFGAPLEMEDHSLRAHKTAVEMFEKLYECRGKWCLPGSERVEIGVGISSGQVIVGNMGSDKRINYTVMGDQVNLASRLEGLTKNYGVRILVSEFTRKQAGHKMICREIDLVRVKGRQEPVAVFEPFGKDYFTHGQFSFIPVFEEGLSAYRNQSWEEAIDLFEKVLELKPKDIPSQIFIRRCKIMSQNPPGPDWDGVWIMETK